MGNGEFPERLDLFQRPLPQCLQQLLNVVMLCSTRYQTGAQEPVSALRAAMCATLHAFGEALWVPAPCLSPGLNLSLQQQPWPQQPGHSSDPAALLRTRCWYRSCPVQVLVNVNSGRAKNNRQINLAINPPRRFLAVPDLLATRELCWGKAPGLSLPASIASSRGVLGLQDHNLLNVSISSFMSAHIVSSLFCLS